MHQGIEQGEKLDLQQTDSWCKCGQTFIKEKVTIKLQLLVLHKNVVHQP